MEPRKSVLETVRPTDAIGRLSARSSKARVWTMVGVVVVLLVVAFFIGSIFHATSRGTGNISVPSVR